MKTFAELSHIAVLAKLAAPLRDEQIVTAIDRFIESVTR